MKTLVFNLLVVGALAVLLFDGDPPTTLRGAVDKVAVKADQLVETGKALVAKPAAQPRAGQTPPVTPTPVAQTPVAQTPVDEPGDQPVVATKTPAPAAPVAKAPVAKAPGPVSKTPRPAKPAKAIDAPARALDPEIARRRAEVLGEVPDGAAKEPAATTGFMAPRVRRTELQKLAENMELMFVENVTR